jgi:hypothetical protein
MLLMVPNDQFDHQHVNKSEGIINIMVVFGFQIITWRLFV